MTYNKLQAKLSEINLKHISVFLGSQANCVNSVSLYRKDKIWYVYEIDENGEEHISHGNEKDMCKLV